MMNKFYNNKASTGTSKQQQQLKDKFMTSTHAYYSVQHFWAKDNSGQASPVTSMSICIEDSFTDVIDNDTSERHIVVQVETPTKNQQMIPFSQVTDKFYNSQNQKQHQSRVHDHGLKYSVAQPIPTQPGVTPGEKGGKSKTGSLLFQQENKYANPKQLHFIDKIQEENGGAQALDGGQSISTNPSNSGYDLVVGGNNTYSRQNPFQMSGKQNFHTIDHPTTSNLTKVKKNKPKIVPKKNSQNQAPRNIKDSLMEDYLSSHRSTNRGSNTSTFHSKMDDFLQRKEAKLRALREAKQAKELEGCQFAPNIYTRRRPENPRGFEQFLQDQRRFIENARSKRDQRVEMQEQIEIATIQHGPYMSHRSRQILMDKEKRAQSVESREGSVISAGVSDSATRGNKGQSRMNTLQSPNNHGGFSGPFGNTKKKNAIQLPGRDRPVEDILYQDAIRRQHSIESRQKEALSKTREIANTSALVSKESQKLVIQKFEREVNQGVQELFETQRDLKISDLLSEKVTALSQEVTLPSTINYLVMKLLMVRLGCCSEEQTFTECPESDLLFQMWKHLSQDHDFLRSDHDELPVDRLKLFLMVILRVAEARVLQDYLTQGSQHGFKFDEAPALVKRFEMFYVNRLNFQAKQQQQKKQEMETLQTQGMSFRPQLSDTTIQLAQRKLSKMHPNHLMQTLKPGSIMNNFFSTQEAKEIQECTFQPFVSENSRKLSSTRKLIGDPHVPTTTHSVLVNTDKCAELYEFSKHLQALKKTVTDKTTEEVEFERSKEQCTFKPVIHPAPPGEAPQPLQNDPQMTRLHLDRQNRAREERARVRDIKERGWSKGAPALRSQSRGEEKASNKGGSINTSLVAQRHKESVNRSKLASAGLNNQIEASKQQALRIPLLLVDIGIGDRKERIAVYEGDKAETLAREFCKKHGLDMDNIAVRLQEEIERQIQLISQQQRIKVK